MHTYLYTTLGCNCHTAARVVVDRRIGFVASPEHLHGVGTISWTWSAHGRAVVIGVGARGFTPRLGPEWMI